MHSHDNGMTIGLQAEMERGAANRACAIRRQAKFSWSRYAGYARIAGFHPIRSSRAFRQ